MKVICVLASQKHPQSVQYSAALAVAGAYKDTSNDKLSDNLVWKYLYHKQWLNP